VAQVFVGEAGFLGTEKQRDVARCEAFTDQACAGLEASKRVLQIAMAHSRGSHDERAVRHSFRHRAEFFCARENRSASHGGTSFAKRRFVGIHDTQMYATEIAHRARSRADVQRIARRDQHDAQAVEFARSRQAPILCQVVRTWFGEVLGVASFDRSRVPEGRRSWDLMSG